MIENPPDQNQLELVVIAPGFVCGRPLFKSEFSSAGITTKLMTGILPKAPDVNVPFVNVEDVAKAHVLALDCSSGERFAILEGTHGLVEIGQAFHDEFSKYGYKCSNEKMDLEFAQELSKKVKELEYFLSIWGKRINVKNDKSIGKLGIKEYKTLNKTIPEMGWSFIELGMVEDLTKNW